MKDNIKFYGTIALLGSLILSFCYIIGVILLPATECTSMLFIEGISLLGCYLLLGIGLGFPLVIIATILGWLQLVLLISGNINPHLAREGFFKVVNTLFSKI